MALTMRVTKRNGNTEPVAFDKITERISILSKDLQVDPINIALQTIRSIHDGISTERLDQISAKTAESGKRIHPDYSTLAARIVISNLHKSTPSRFSNCMRALALGTQQISKTHLDFIMYNADVLDAMIIDSNDYLFDYFGYKTLENSYLLKIKGAICDRPQYVFMRVAIAININQPQPLENIKNCYKLLSQMYFIHATPTLFNACGVTQQLLSCFLLGTDDSIEGIMHNATNTSLISKWAGGIGIHMSNIRPQNSIIHKTGGRASGLPQQLKIYNELARCWNQGGKRNGAFAIYIEPHHGDIMQFLRMKLQQGADTERARDLFYAVWCSDLFVKRALAKQMWSLFSEADAKGLSDVYDGMMVCSVCSHCKNPAYNKYVAAVGVKCDVCDYVPVAAYTILYERYEKEGLALSTLPAMDIVDAIVFAQRENGVPYICHKDHCNRQSAQQALGTVKSSNLCVTGDTMILTDQGQRQIGSIVGRKINIWNGEEWSQVTPTQTGVDQPVIDVNLSNSVTIKCTPYHKFYIVRDSVTVMVQASELTHGDELIKYNLPPKQDTNLLYIDCDKPRSLEMRLYYQTKGYDSIVKNGKLIYVTVPITVESVVDRGETADTFCFTEPKRGMGMFNGVLTGNCSEITEWSDDKSYACCTLASINLKRFILHDKTFDFKKLHDVVMVIVRNLDIIIDENVYPVPECIENSKRYRPIGIGIQALADVFSILRIPFMSAEAADLDLKIMETIYFAALTESCARAQTHGKWDGFDDSPAASGKLRFDLWDENQEYLRSIQGHRLQIATTLDWEPLRANIKRYGLRNSLLVALMPTVSTSQIMGNNESFEPFSANIYTKSTLGGKYYVCNNAMIHHLTELGLWNEATKNLVQVNGSIQDIPSIPADVKEIYKTVWEVKQKDLMKRAAMRNAFVCQSQSLNIHLNNNSDSVLRGVFFEGWSLGLTTGNYYIRTQAATRAMPTQVVAAAPVYSPPAELVIPTEADEEYEDGAACPIGCTSCSA